MGVAPSKLALCIDYGSSELKVTYQAVQPTYTLANTNIKAIRFDGNETAVKQIVVWTEDLDGIVFGKQAVESYLHDQPNKEDRVIRMPKLALLDGFQHEPCVQAFYRFVGISPDDLEDGLSDYGRDRLITFFTGHLLAIRTSIIKHFLKGADPSAAKKTIAAWLCVTETTLTSTCKMSDKAKAIMKQAMANAGYGSIQIQLKPVNTALVRTPGLVRDKQIHIGDVLLSIHSGYCTTGVAVVRIGGLLEHVESGSDSQVLESADGPGIGSNMINTAICEWVKESREVQAHGGFNHWMKCSGLTETTFHESVWLTAEEQKMKVGKRTFMDQLQIRGSYYSKYDVTMVQLKEDRMKSFCNKQVAGIMKVVKGILQLPNTPKINAVLLGGGSFRNVEVREKLRQALGAELEVECLYKDDKLLGTY